MTPLDLFICGPPNGLKAAIMLGETELPYGVRLVDIEAGEQKRAGALRSLKPDRGPCSDRACGFDQAGRRPAVQRGL